MRVGVALRVARVHGREVEGERASLVDRALGLDLAAEQPGDLPADRETEAGAAVAPARGAVGLLERLEDEAELVLRDTDTGVDDGEGHDPVGAAEGVVEKA